MVLWDDTVQSATRTPTLQRDTPPQKSVMLRRCLSVRLHKAYRVDGHRMYTVCILRNYQTIRHPSTKGHIKNLHQLENLRSHIQHKYGTVYRCRKCRLTPDKVSSDFCTTLYSDKHVIQIKP